MISVILTIMQEETLEIEYIESLLPPQKMSDQPHEDWVSSVSCELQGCVSVLLAPFRILVGKTAPSILISELVFRLL